QEPEAILQHLDYAVADDLNLLRRELLEDGEHQLLLAHHAGVFHFQRFGKRNEIGRLLVLEFAEFHFLHGWTLGVRKGENAALKRKAGRGRWVRRRCTGRKTRLLAARQAKSKALLPFHAPLRTVSQSPE